jgi:hypothetical protein
VSHDKVGSLASQRGLPVKSEQLKALRGQSVVLRRLAQLYSRRAGGCGAGSDRSAAGCTSHSAGTLGELKAATGSFW